LAIGTVGERTTRFVVLLHLPPENTGICDALIEAMAVFPIGLRRSLTGDQGGHVILHGDGDVPQSGGSCSHAHLRPFAARPAER